MIQKSPSLPHGLGANPQHNLSEQNVAKIQNVIQMAQKMVENMSVGGQGSADAMTNLERYKQKLRS